MASAEPKQQARTLLIAVDASPQSQYALDWAQDMLLSPHSEDNVVLVNVRPITLSQSPVAIFDDVNALIHQAEDESRIQSHRLLQHYGQQLKRRGITSIRAVSIRGDTRCDIIRKATAIEASLIVVGSRGLGALRRTFLGSVSDYIVNHAPCPVLVVRPSSSHETLYPPSALHNQLPSTNDHKHGQHSAESASVEVQHIDYTIEPSIPSINSSSALLSTKKQPLQLVDPTDPHESDDAHQPLLAA